MDFEDDPLQSALATAFADSSIPQRNVASSASQSTSSADQEVTVVPETTVEDSDESWKSSYDALVTGWRAESATVRHKAEQERERWRLVREREEAEERKKAAELGADHQQTKEVAWEAVERARRAQESKPAASQGVRDSGRRLSIAKEAATGIRDGPPRHGSPSPNDSRDLVSGETPRRHGGVSPESLLPRPEPHTSEYAAGSQAHVDVSASVTAPPSNSESKTWEEVPSLDSSFPSLSFPDRSAAPSPEPRERPPPPPSVTLAIFDSSLSTRTRVLALVSSLAINLFLPFVNGVMLGFGEIFAKNVVGAFGWNLPGMGVGIRGGPRRKQG